MKIKDLLGHLKHDMPNLISLLNIFKVAIPDKQFFVARENNKMNSFQNFVECIQDLYDKISDCNT